MQVKRTLFRIIIAAQPPIFGRLVDRNIIRDDYKVFVDFLSAILASVTLDNEIPAFLSSDWGSAGLRLDSR